MTTSQAEHTSCMAMGPALGSILNNVICNLNENIARTLVRFAVMQNQNEGIIPYSTEYQTQAHT